MYERIFFSLGEEKKLLSSPFRKIVSSHHILFYTVSKLNIHFMYYPRMHEIHTEILWSKKVILIKYNNALDIVKVEFNSFFYKTRKLPK